MDIPETAIETANPLINISAVTIQFKTPTHGYWDGGLRKGGTFEPEIVDGGYEGHWNVKQHVKWGCYELNFYMRMPIKNNDPEIIRKNFIKKLHATSRVKFNVIKS